MEEDGVDEDGVEEDGAMCDGAVFSIDAVGLSMSDMHAQDLFLLEDTFLFDEEER